MQLSKKSLIVASGILIALLCGVGIGLVLVYREVGMQVEVIPVYELQLLHADKATPFEFYDFGTGIRGEYMKTAEILEEAQWLINAGETTLYIYSSGYAFGTKDSKDIQIYFEKDIGGGYFTGIANGTAIQPAEEWRVRFQAQINPEVAFGVHTWTVTIEGRDA